MRFNRIAAATIALGVVVGGLAACTPSPTEDEELVLRAADPGPPITWDAAGFFGVEGIAGAAVYDALLIRVDGLRVDPWLVKEFSYDDDRTVLTLELRDDVDFIDGEHFDAEVAKMNIDLQRGPDGGDAPFFSAIEEVVVTGEYSVEVRLSRPDGELLAWLAKKGVISPAAIDDREGLATTPVGSGPYILDETVGDSEFTFVRNEDYWNPDAYPWDRIELTIMPDITARINALKSGQIDFAPIDYATAAEAESSGLALNVSFSQWTGLFFGDRRGEMNPAIGDVRVRQAITMALDRVTYAETATGGYANASNQVGVEGQAGYYLEDRAGDYAYDLDAARDLMAEAGYADGFDLVLPNPSFWATYKPYFDQAFSDLGIRIEYVDIPDDILFQEFLSGKFPVLPFGAFYNDLSLVKPDGQWNPWHNTDAETDELLAAINGGTDEEALAATEGLTEKILDEAWFAILTHEPTIYAFDASLTASVNGWSLVPLSNIQLK